MHQNKDLALDEWINELKQSDVFELITGRISDSAETIGILLADHKNLAKHPELTEREAMLKASALVGLHALCSTLETISVSNRLVELEKLRAHNRIAENLNRIAANNQINELEKLRSYQRIASSLERIANSLNRIEAKQNMEGA